MRDLVAVRLQRPNRAAEEPEPVRALILRGGLEEQLHAEADAEHRDPRLDSSGDQLVEPALAHPLHRPREGADAGQDDPVGRLRPVPR